MFASSKRRNPLAGALLLALALVLSGAAGAVAQSPDWAWGHPSPQGNPIFGIVFQDDRIGWAVAGGGEILRTDDGADSWRLLRRTHEMSSQLLDILRLGDGTLIAAGDGVYRSGDGGFGWEELAVPAAGPFYDLTGIPGGGVSAAGAGGAVIVSTDGGDSWQEVGPGEGIVFRHVWVSATEAFVVGQGIDRRTIDGGATWTEIIPTTSFEFFDIFFTSATTGFLHEAFATWRTDDGGDTWNEIPQSSPQDPLYRNSTLVLTPEHWLLTVHGEGGGLYETLDAGVTWQILQETGHIGFPGLAATPGGRIVIGASNGSLLVSDDQGLTLVDSVDNGTVHSPYTSVSSFHERPDGVIFAYGYASAFGNGPEWLRSDDGGLNWETAPFPSQTGYLRGIDWLDASRAVMATAGELGVTADGGESWIPSDFGTMVPGKVALPATDRWFVAGSFGASVGSLYRSRDEGQTWQEVATGLPTGNYLVELLQFADADRGLASGKVNGNLQSFHTTDGGETWSPATGLPTGDVSLYACSLPVSGAAILGAASFTISGVIGRNFRSTDAGASWSLIPSVPAAFTQVARPAPGLIVGACSQGLYRSQDDGQTWSRMTTERIDRVAFCDAQHGLAQHFFDRRMLISDDGGLTWSETISPLASPIPPLETYSQPTALAATERGWLVGGVSMRIALGTWNGPAAVEPPVADLPPAGVSLDAPFPNPTNPSTDIRFHLARSGPVTVTIHDLAGRRVRTLVRESLEAGPHTVTWSGDGDDGRAAASGLYLVRVSSGGRQATAKVTVIR